MRAGSGYSPGGQQQPSVDPTGDNPEGLDRLGALAAAAAAAATGSGSAGRVGRRRGRSRNRAAPILLLRRRRRPLVGQPTDRRRWRLLSLRPATAGERLWHHDWHHMLSFFSFEEETVIYHDTVLIY